MMEKFDILYMRMESLIREKESENRSESGSEKDVPSPSDCRSSPYLVQGARKRKPGKDAVQKLEAEIKKVHFERKHNPPTEYLGRHMFCSDNCLCHSNSEHLSARVQFPRYAKHD